MNGALAITAASLHGALIAFLVVGGPASVRWPSLARPHLVAALATGSVFVAGLDCPLTVAEDHFRRAAGWTVPETGFVARYLVEPMHAGGITPPIQVALVAAWVLPSAIGHHIRRRNVAASAISGRAIAASSVDAHG